LGTHERTIGFLIEHFSGAFPPWLAPVQAVVMPIAERHQPYGAKVLESLRAAGVRAELAQDQTLNYRIRAAQKQKVPYMMILGDREVEDSQVAIRLRSGENLDPMGVDAALAMITDKISTRAID
jgi:threonyl-tRNA synthetase